MTTRFSTPCTISTTGSRFPAGRTCARLQDTPSGKGAHWRAIYDDNGRIMVAISYNSDIGDAWEWADDPRYPEQVSDLAIRIGVNYVVYAMTH